VPTTALGRQIGFLPPAQEDALTAAIHAAFDLDWGRPAPSSGPSNVVSAHHESESAAVVLTGLNDGGS